MKKAMRTALVAAWSVLVAAFAAAQRPSGTEVGTIKGSAYRIDVPKDWNGSLVLYLHGYDVQPRKFTREQQLESVPALLLRKHYAVAQSGFSRGGWAVDEGLDDAEALLDFFQQKYGPTKRVYVAGQSFGGFLTALLLERHPQQFDGGLAMCAPLGPAAWFMSRRVFDSRVVFDRYFPKQLPDPTSIGPNFAVEPAIIVEITHKLNASPAEAAAVRQFTGIRSNEELAFAIVFFTGILADVEAKAGGNPFDNHGVVYSDQSDTLLDQKVERYTAREPAALYLGRHAPVTGHIARPLLSLQTAYDPFLPPWLANYYGMLASSAGSQRWFEQKVFERAGHCAFEPQDIAESFSELERRGDRAMPSKPGAVLPDRGGRVLRSSGQKQIGEHQWQK